MHCDSCESVIYKKSAVTLRALKEEDPQVSREACLWVLVARTVGRWAVNASSGGRSGVTRKTSDNVRHEDGADARTVQMCNAARCKRPQDYTSRRKFSTWIQNA